ncbi:hypothetical protein Pla52o_50730 [Novipirellula galeiformis]|uniref:Peptidase MA-like domain-containing protein n=1 Tax=Novipirellula galeiformis TaxID=2528004 RepID=A0A5C6C0L9_9BACT|nr:hypothetical protein Pla52o_50730 [Novipirellula galeiformis]
MEAGLILRRLVFAVAGIASAVLVGNGAEAANFRTQNFLIHAPDQALAQAVGEAAERYRKDLATYWLGAPLPPWPVPCPVRVVSGPQLAAQGVTTYNRAPVRDFQMEVVGTPERILDSVLPHEVTHTILATHFGRPLPRWADEGICTTVEHESERQKHEAKLREFLGTRRGIAMNKLFLLTEYPNDVLPMYAQGYSVCRFLIDQDSPQTFIQFLQDYMQNPSWTANVRKHYGYESLAELQDYWLAWVAAGSGPVEKFAKRGSNIDVGDSRVAINSPSNNVAPVNSTVDPRATGSVRLAQMETPSPATRSQSAATQATALASSHANGWYQRRKLDGDHQTDAVAANPAAQPGYGRSTPPSNSNRGMASDRLLPPSVRRSSTYSAAQPQPEQSFSRSGIALRPLQQAPESAQSYPGGSDIRPPSPTFFR